MTTTSLKCRITILKRTLNRDLIKDHLEDEYKDRGPCEIFEDGQEFLFEGYKPLEDVPEGFCPSAWADLRRDIFTVMVGGDIPGMKEKGVTIGCCSDWFRPVYFKIERIEPSEQEEAGNRL